MSGQAIRNRHDADREPACADPDAGGRQGARRLRLGLALVLGALAGATLFARRAEGRSEGGRLDRR
ncbi:hypothetical protein [Methylobacterium nigriterrae]|uniref:hypothetical protein n=1 Tax=Methylobacterium nigriterrae TaxID=3127512 RepID=UPI00301334D4